MNRTVSLKIVQSTGVRVFLFSLCIFFIHHSYVKALLKCRKRLMLHEEYKLHLKKKKKKACEEFFKLLMYTQFCFSYMIDFNLF